MPNTYYPWHIWFAWRPVFTKDQGWRWMTKVYRRHGFHLSPIPHGHDGWFWEYMTNHPSKETNQ